MRDDLAADFYIVFLNTDDFAEWATYYPKDGPSRRVVVYAPEVSGGLHNMPIASDQERLARMSFGRDKEHAKGGVDQPKLGDALHLDADPDEVRYVWTGETLASSSYHHELRFRYTRQHRTGTNQTLIR